MNYFKFIAEDVRNHLSIMGITKLEDIIGQTQYLETIKGLESQGNIEMQGIQLDASELVMILKSDYEDYKARATPVQTAQLPKPIQDPKLEKRLIQILKNI